MEQIPDSHDSQLEENFDFSTENLEPTNGVDT